MSKSSRAKTIKFTIQFDQPPKDEVIEMTVCPYCKAKKGDECYTRPWSAFSEQGNKRMSNLHHDRYAVYMNLKVVSPGLLYEIN